MTAALVALMQMDYTWSSRKRRCSSTVTLSALVVAVGYELWSRSATFMDPPYPPYQSVNRQRVYAQQGGQSAALMG